MKVEAVNMGYNGDGVWVLKEDGSVGEYTFNELGYPYFWSSKYVRNADVVNVKEEKLKVLFMNEVKEMNLWKIEFRTPALVSRNRKGLVVEGNIKYIERRLGADGIVDWVMPKRYAYIDIEVYGENNNILIGMVEVDEGKEGEYIHFKDVREFLKFIKQRKIGMVLAWNGIRYDYKVIDTYGGKDDEYWQKVLKLDAMEVYTGGRIKSLEVAGIDERVGNKMKVNFGNVSEVELIEYNKNDVLLMKRILDKTGDLDVHYALAKETGVMPGIYFQTWLAENYIMKNRDKFGIWLLDKNIESKEGNVKGAWIWIKKAGLYDNIAVYDYNSLYPSVVLNESYASEGKAVFEFVRSVLKDFIIKKDEYGKLAKETGKEIYSNLRGVYKILANGLYGMTILPSWRYYSSEMGNFITGKGREMVQRMKAYIESLGYEVLYADTDSNFVRVNSENEAGVLEKYINKFVYPYTVKLDKYFEKLLLIGDEDRAVKKRYAGKTSDGKMVVVGLEIRRSDWTAIAKKVEEDVLNFILNGQEKEVEEYLKGIKNIFASRNVNVEDLAFIKAIDVEREYKVKVRHLKAYEKAKKFGGLSEGIVFVKYWMGKRGEIVVEGEYDRDELRNVLDWNWYYNSQIKMPISRIMLAIGNNRQMKLDKMEDGIFYAQEVIKDE